jgi:Tfp pilus assembly protein PilX
MQERMAGNFEQYGRAFQNAEATLRTIESRLQGLRGGTAGLGVIESWASYQAANSVTLEINDCTLERAYGGSWDSANWTALTDTPGEYLIIDLLDQPACRPMEEDTGRPQGAYFLIVARATDGLAQGAREAEAIVQSLFFWPG